jgi:4-amino-4-deoxy-L-arabinose transferase-like glycosyltransferase
MDGPLFLRPWLVRFTAHRYLPALFLLCLSCLFFLLRLPLPLLEPEEARYAEIPRQMLEQGRFVVPVLHGEDYLHKPPLLYWLVMGCYQMFGVQDWSARLVPALASIFTVLIVYGWARRVVGSWAAWWSGLLLCLTPRYLYLAGMLNFDSLLSLWVIGGLAAGHLGLELRFRAAGKKWAGVGWWILSGLCCGLGVLTKGPVALVLVFGHLSLWAMYLAMLHRPSLSAQRRALRPFTGRSGADIPAGAAPGFRGVILWVLGYLAVVLLVAGPWFLLLVRTHPAALAEFFWLHHFQRFLTPFDHAQPWWYYLPSISLGMLPWALLFPAMLWMIGKRRSYLRRRLSPAWLFYLGAACWCLLFFSISGCKRPGYVLPVFPLLALALGTFVGRAWPRWTWFQASAQVQPKWGRLVLMAIMILVSMGPLTMGAMRWWSWFQTGIVLAILGCFLGMIWLWATNRRSRTESAGRCAAALWLTASGIMAGLVMACLVLVLPRYFARFSLHSQVQPLRRWIDAEPGMVVCYPRRWDSVSYYLRRSDVVDLDPTELTAGFVWPDWSWCLVKNASTLQDLRERLPPGMTVTMVESRFGLIAVKVAKHGPN